MADVDPEAQPADTNDMDTLAPHEQQVLNAALVDARQHGRLRGFPTLEALRNAVAPFFSDDSRPEILDTWDPDDDFFGVAIVAPGPGLEPGDWRAGPVSCDGRDGIVVVFVVDEETARALEGRASSP